MAPTRRSLPRLNPRINEDWWAVQDSNLRPPVCKTDALPTELTALSPKTQQIVKELTAKVKTFYAKNTKIAYRNEVTQI